MTFIIESKSSRKSKVVADKLYVMFAEKLTCGERARNIEDTVSGVAQDQIIHFIYHSFAAHKNCS